MKVLILTLNDNILHGFFTNESASFLSGLCFQKSVEVAGVYTLPTNYEHLAPFFQNLPLDVTSVVILSNQNLDENLKIKEQFAKCFNTSLVQNELLEQTIQNYFKENNIPLEKNSLKEASILKGATPISNNYAPEQGFVLFEEGRHYLFLPSNLEVLKKTYESWFFNYLQSKVYKTMLLQTIKTFGLTLGEAQSLLSDLFKNKNQIKIEIYPQNLELTILIKYSPLSPIDDVNAFIDNVKDRLKNFIYTCNDKTIYEVLDELLQKTNTKIAIAEDITCGNIVSNLLKISKEAYQYFVEGLVATNEEAKINRLMLQDKFLRQNTDVNTEVAYEMAAGLLQTAKEADMVLVTCGDLQEFSKNKGLSFIALGNYEGIHIYKNKFGNTREQIIDQTSKAAAFYLIKKLKEKI